MFADTANFRPPSHSAPVTLRIYKIPHELVCHIDPTPSDQVSECEGGGIRGIGRPSLRQSFAKLAERMRITVRTRLGALILRIVWSKMPDARFLREAFEF